MQRRALAKINLSLHVTGRREDGYHVLDSVVAFAEEAFDTLDAFPDNELSLSVDGDSGPIAPLDNLVVKAAELLRSYSDINYGVKLQLAKTLPVGGGIGGGSADAAAALHLLNEIWRLGLTREQLMELALPLGADVPVCIHGKAARMEGIGEVITPLALPELHAVLVNPRVHVETRKVFAQGVPAGSPLPPLPAKKADMPGWLKLQRNDLQPYAVRLAPAIQDTLRILALQEGCSFSRMSGSGSTCFGLFVSRKAAELAAAEIKTLQPHWWVVATALI